MIQAFFSGPRLRAAHVVRAGRALLLAGAVLLPTVAGLFLPGVALAQDAGPQTIVSVDWGESPPLSPERLQRASGLTPGAVLDPALLAAAVRALSDLPEVHQAAVSARPVAGGVAVRVSLTGMQVMGNLTVRGNRHLDSGEVTRAARLDAGHEVDSEILRRAAGLVQEAYAARGYLSARVEARVGEAGNDPMGRTPVVLVINEGPRARVTEVRLPGVPGAAADGVPLPRGLSLSTRKGRALNPARTEKDLNRIETFLAKRGYLHPQAGPYRLEYDPKEGATGVGVVIPVRVGDRVRLHVRGDRHLSRREVFDGLGLGSYQTVDQPMLLEAANRLQRQLVGRGYRDARVSATASSDVTDPRRMVHIRVEIHQGRRHRIQDIRFTGNHNFNTGQLRDLVSPGFRLTNEPARAAVLRERAGRIEGALHTLGFPDAGVTFSLDQVGRRTDLVAVTYHITEGPRWWLDRASLQTTGEVEPQVRDQAQAMLREQEGVPYHRDRLRIAKTQVTRLFAEAGYVDAEVSVTRKPRDEWRGRITPRGQPLREVRVEAEFQVDPGPRVRVGEITIEGRFRTRREVVWRELTFKHGDFLRPSALAETRRRLFRTAAFDQVRIGPADTADQDAERDISVKVEEGKPGAVELGVGYGEEDGVRGLVDLSYRDFLRRGHRVNLRMRSGQLRRSLSLGYVLPWIGNWRADLRSRILFEREDLISYERVTRAAETGLRRELTDNVTVTTTYRVERNHYPRLPADLVAALPERRRINVGSVQVSVARDTRDDPFSPSGGSLLGATYEQGAHVLISDIQFGKATLQAAGYHPIGRRLVLAGKVQTGRVRRLFDTTQVPISERFFLGGASTVRGYRLDALGVPGESLISGVPQGGRVMNLVNVELRIGASAGWGTVLFADAGNVWDHGHTIGIGDFRAGAGFGLHYATPVGPLRLDLGYKIDRRQGEDPYRLHFTLGHSF
ncbi:MAG: BamA/TamA family outer membrane protein [Nitrospirota bacterium]|nr:BamA/TamA family outer membrane protein [Nitrospirota bacterium]